MQERAEAGLNRAVLEQTCPAENQKKKKKKKSPQRWAALLPATQNATFGDKQPPGDRDPPHQGVWESQLLAGGASSLTLFVSVYSNRNQAASTSQRHPTPPFILISQTDLSAAGSDMTAFLTKGKLLSVTMGTEATAGSQIYIILKEKAP